MSKPPASNEHHFGSKTTGKTTLTSTPTSATGMAKAKAANIEDILSEMREMRAEIRADLKEIKASLDTLKSDNQDIKQGLKGINNTVETLEDKVSENTTDIVEMKADMKEWDSEMTLLKQQVEGLLNRERNRNLRIFGIPEKAEGSQPLDEFIQKMLPTWIGLNPDRVFELEYVYRALGKPNQNRAVVVRFKNFKDKVFIYREARKKEVKYDGQRVRFVQDLSAETLRVRRGFQPVIQRFIDKNAFRGFQYNPCRLRILYQDRIHLFSTLQQAEDFYKGMTATSPGTE